MTIKKKRIKSMKKIIGEAAGQSEEFRERKVERTSQCLLCSSLTFLILSGSSTSQMAAPNELKVIHHPKRSKIILISYKTFMQGQVGANSVLCSKRKKSGKRRRRRQRTVLEGGTKKKNTRNMVTKNVKWSRNCRETFSFVILSLHL